MPGHHHINHGYQKASPSSSPQNANANAQIAMSLHSAQPTAINHTASQHRDTGRPRLPYPLHRIPKLLARDSLPALTPQRRMLIRIVKRILEEPHVRALHRPKHGLELRVAQARADAPHGRPRRRRRRRGTRQGRGTAASARGRRRRSRHGGAAASPQGSSSARADAAAARLDAPPAHVDDADHAHARVGLEAVRREAVVDGVQQAKVARGGAVLGAQVEDVDGGGEQEGELEGVPDRDEGVC